MSAARRLPTGLPPPRRDCFFTTILVRDGLPLHWGAHRDRLEATCRTVLGLALPEDLDARVAEAARGEPGRRRLVVRVATEGGRPVVEVSARPAPVARTAALRLLTVEGRSGDWRHKWCDRSQLEQAQALVGPACAPVFVDGAGRLLETATAALAFVAPPVLVVPPADANALPSVTLLLIRQRAEAAGWDVAERLVAPGEADAFCVFAVSSISGAVEVGSIDGRATRNGREVPSSEALLSAWAADG